jgi:thiamine transporter ThiT
MFFSPFLLFTQEIPGGTGEGRGNYLTLKVAVMGPGDELYFWWGHIALVIEDALTGESRFYDYGIFSFTKDHFFTNFAFGRLLYSSGVSRTDPSLAIYRKTNRDITLYTLDLPAAKREEIFRFAEWNVLPENRDYFYHHFKDNCATRIRDIIDLATDGQFKGRFADAPGRYTYRQHVRRHTWFNPFFDWILNFWMGQDIDTPITIWEEMFLPQEIGSRIQDFTYRDAAGIERKLVRSVEVVNRAVNRPHVLDTPRRQWPRELALGCFIALILALFACLRRRTGRAAHLCRILWGLCQSGLGLFFGIAGTLLCFLSFFTNHDYSYHNSNVLFVNPLLLAAVPLGILAAFGSELKRPRRERLLRILWTYVLFGGLLTMAIKLLPGFYQQNQVTQALVLPFAFVLSYAPRWLLKRHGQH